MANVKLEIEDRLAMVTLCRPDNGNRVDERTAARHDGSDHGRR